jgi:hypothetical protein
MVALICPVVVTAVRILREGPAGLGGSAWQGRREWASRPPPATIESKFIDDCNGDRRAGQNYFCGVWRTAQVLLYSPELSTGRSPIGTSGGSVAN